MRRAPNPDAAAAAQSSPMLEFDIHVPSCLITLAAFVAWDVVAHMCLLQLTEYAASVPWSLATMIMSLLACHCLVEAACKCTNRARHGTWFLADEPVAATFQSASFLARLRPVALLMAIDVLLLVVTWYLPFVRLLLPVTVAELGRDTPGAASFGIILVFQSALCHYATPAFVCAHVLLFFAVRMCTRIYLLWDKPHAAVAAGPHDEDDKEHEQGDQDDEDDQEEHKQHDANCDDDCED